MENEEGGEVAEMEVNEDVFKVKTRRERTAGREVGRKRERGGVRARRAGGGKDGERGGGQGRA